MISIIDYFEDKANKYPNNALIWEKLDGVYHPTTYQESLNLVRTYAAGLLSMGLQKGDRVSLLSEGRRDWLIAELAILYTGAVNVPLSTKLEEANDLVFRINHSDSKLMIVSAFHVDKIRKIQGELPKLEKIIVLGKA
ncbi:MAG: AMP-binding protein, partial [Bacteroidales bacterium]|nr:AMP-binding protein [Bacteroidales bacterium]